MATYWAKHPHIFPCFQLFPKFCAVEVDGLRYPFCTFRFGAIDQHRENVFIVFHVADSTPVQRDLQPDCSYGAWVGFVLDSWQIGNRGIDCVLISCRSLVCNGQRIRGGIS